MTFIEKRISITTEVTEGREKNFFLNISCWAPSSDTREMCLINHSSMKDEEKEEKKGVIGKEGDKIDKI